MHNNKKSIFDKSIKSGKIKAIFHCLVFQILICLLISKSIIKIRQSKLPDPKEIGNSGSFFKNPIISKEYFGKLKEKFPEIVSYPINKKEVNKKNASLSVLCYLMNNNTSKVNPIYFIFYIIQNYGFTFFMIKCPLY